MTPVGAIHTVAKRGGKPVPNAASDDAMLIERVESEAA